MKNQLNAKVKDVHFINENLMILKVEKDNEIFQFEPGQFATIGLVQRGKVIKRAYSVASKNGSSQIELFISRVENGVLTKKIFNLKKNDKLWLGEKITGFFTLKPVTEPNLILVATGTGICPYLSMLRTYPELGTKQGKIALIHGVRKFKDFGYLDEFLKIQKARSNFYFFPIISRETKQNIPKGRVQDILNSNNFKETYSIIDPKNTAVMLCGNPQMIEDLTGRFYNLGFKKHTRNSKGNLHYEKYWTIPKTTNRS